MKKNKKISRFFWVSLVISMLFLTAQSKAAVQPFIIGGHEVSAQDPVAQSTVLIIGKIYRASFTCTGVVIGDDLILTAGHCLGAGGFAELNVHFKTNINAGGPVIKVKNQLRPWAQMPTGDYNWDDIAILKLESKIPGTHHAISFLRDDSLLQNGRSILLAGYGRTTPSEPTSGNGGLGILRAVEQKIIDVRYSDSEVLIDIQNKGACAGDSGGPALMQVGGDWQLFGVASRMTEKNLVSSGGRSKEYACTVDMIYSNVLKQQAWIQKAIAEINKP